MVGDRFGEGLFDDPPPEEPRHGQERRADERTWDATGWDERIDDEERIPWIGVHVLTQFVFCPRAGILAYEQRRTEEETPPLRASRLDHLPDYLPAMIEEALDAVRCDLWTFTTYASFWIVLLALLSLIHPVLVRLLLLASLIFVPTVYRLIRDYLVLRGRMQLALRAAGRSPDPNISAPQIVNWWELLKADYEPTKPREPYPDRALRLSGKPHLVLTHKGERIPVLRKWTGKEELHRKDYARCGAYAHLVETCERTKVPFVIILFGSGYDGVAVPITASARKAFRDGLDRARYFLKRVAAGEPAPELPKTAQLCRGCDSGRPRPYRRGKSETVIGGVRLAARLTESHERKPYHCDCRDRFGGDVPPHALAVAIGLTD